MTDDATKEYQAEVRRLRAVRDGLRGGSSDEAPHPRRLSLSQILELVLTRGAGERSAVTLTRSPSGDTIIDVKVRTGDDADTATVEDAARRAVEVYERLRETYPVRGAHENASVTLTRNARGETQIDVGAKTSEGGYATLDALVDGVHEAYDKARMKYPMLDGRTAKPGSVA